MVSASSLEAYSTACGVRLPCSSVVSPVRQRTPATEGTRSSAATASERKRSGRASTCSSSASTCSHFSTGRPMEKRYLEKNTSRPPPLRGFHASATSSMPPAARNTVAVSASRYGVPVTLMKVKLPDHHHDQQHQEHAVEEVDDV